MTWLAENWVDIVGWGGSALLIFSLLQARVLRFRVLNLIASIVLLVFNAIIEVWPMAAMNAALAAINIYFVVKLIGERDDDRRFEVIAVAPGDHYLRHVVATHQADINRFQPDFALDPILTDPSIHAFVVVRGDETIGLTVLRAEGSTAHILLDYVTRKYRDFTPGRFVWRHSETMTGLGFTQIRTGAHSTSTYYSRIGFRREDEGYVLDLPAA